MDLSKAPKPNKALLSKHKAAGFAKLAADKTAIEAIKKRANDSIFFDSGAPSTRKRRQTDLTLFQSFVGVIAEDVDIEE